VVGIVVVSHSSELAEGLAALAAQMAGPDVRIEAAGGLPDGSLGTDEDRVRAAIRAADQGAGVVLERHANGHVRLADAPIVEGAVAAAVTASANMPLDDVVRSAEEARGAGKL
jgi:dihydroxyacetone kinase DhaKLM complex PTS-EIIA-like component DhaM